MDESGKTTHFRVGSERVREDEDEDLLEERERKIRGEIEYWNSKKGFGFCKNQAGEEYFIHFSALVPEHERGKDLRGEKIVISSVEEAEESRKKDKVTRAGWGDPNVIDAVVFRESDGALAYKEDRSGVMYHHVDDEGYTGDDLDIEEGSFWKLEVYSGRGSRPVVHLVKELASRQEFRKMKKEKNLHGISKKYKEWVEKYKKRRRKHKTLQKLDIKHFRTIGGVVNSSKVKLDPEGWVYAEIDRVTDTIYARPKLEHSTHTEQVTGHYGDESWDIPGRTIKVSRSKEVRPEIVFQMPKEIRDMETVFTDSPVIAEISAVSRMKGYGSITCAFDEQGNISAIWVEKKRCWRRPSANINNIVNNRDKEVLDYNKTDSANLWFMEVFMANKQGLNLGDVVKWDVESS